MQASLPPRPPGKVGRREEPLLVGQADNPSCAALSGPHGELWARTALQCCPESSNCPAPSHPHTNKSSDMGRCGEGAPFSGGQPLGRSEPALAGGGLRSHSRGVRVSVLQRGVWGQCASTVQRERLGGMTKESPP